MSYDSDITVLSDLECQEEFDQLLEDEEIFVYKENNLINIPDLVEQDTSLISGMRIDGITSVSQDRLSLRIWISRICHMTECSDR